MSNKTSLEIAGDITVAWINALGSAAGNPSPVSQIALENLLDQNKIAEMLTLVIKAIQER